MKDEKEQALGMQAGFHCHTCALCGMTYAPGEEADEKLHAAHHAKLVQGIRFHVSLHACLLFVLQKGSCIPLASAQHSSCLLLTLLLRHTVTSERVRVQGWQNERVLHRDGLSGYVLLVLPTDPAPHLKKVVHGRQGTVGPCLATLHHCSADINATQCCANLACQTA